MLSLTLLKAKWTLMGLEAPQFIWLAVFGLLRGTMVQLARLRRAVFQYGQMQPHVLAQQQELGAEHDSGKCTGLPEDTY